MTDLDAIRERHYERSDGDCNECWVAWPCDTAHTLARLADLETALETAWGIIANAGGGDWTRETQMWQDAAARWRDEWLPTINEHAALARPESEEAQ